MLDFLIWHVNLINPELFGRLKRYALEHVSDEELGFLLARGAFFRATKFKDIGGLYSSRDALHSNLGSITLLRLPDSMRPRSRRTLFAVFRYLGDAIETTLVELRAYLNTRRDSHLKRRMLTRLDELEKTYYGLSGEAWEYKKVSKAIEILNELSELAATLKRECA